jgi:hypothetical protein
MRERSESRLTLVKNAFPFHDSRIPWNHSFACFIEARRLKFHALLLSSTDSTSAPVNGMFLWPFTWMMQPSLTTACSKYRPESRSARARPRRPAIHPGSRWHLSCFPVFDERRGDHCDS